MRNLVIMPTENKERMNLGEFAEEATIIEETATPKRVNHFIEANTQEATLQHLKNDCITPVFAKDNVEWVSPLTGAFPSKNRTCEFPRIRLKQHDRYRLCYR